MQLLFVVVLGMLAIAAATALGPRFGVASPLLLVLAGIGVSFLPFVPDVTIAPEWILAGVLPPLLYSASVSLPAMNFRREFRAISGLSVILVVATSVVLGVFFAWLIPGLGLGWGIALGAIVSPTDAVATSIVKRTAVSPRVVAILEGESLLNDATALVLLRTAIASVGVAISFWSVIGEFAFAVIVAVIIGYAVGRLNLIIRARVSDATVNTVISFTVPFIASIPAELLGASGLVAAVVAGLVTGRRAPRVLSPQHRLSDSQNWRTVELVLEGTVFLTMGLELSAIVSKVQLEHSGFGLALIVAVGALALTIIVRALYVAPLLAGLRLSARRKASMKPQITQMQQSLDDPATAGPARAEIASGRRRPMSQVDLGRFATRVTRTLADIDYFLNAPLGWREGTVVVWAGMRGAITVAAAQTLPNNSPDRAFLILVAFLVAALSLIVQGGTLGAVIRWIKPAVPDPAVMRDERIRLMALLDDARPDAVADAAADAAADADAAAGAATRDGAQPGTVAGPERAEVVAGNPGAQPKRQALALIVAKRKALLDARDDGTFDAGALESALVALDAEQITLELQGDPFE